MRILTRDHVVQKLREVLSKRKEVKLAYLIGSIAERGFSYHDVDVAILLDCNPNDKLKLLGEIHNDICKALSISDDRVDIIPIDEVDWHFKYRIVKGIKLVDRDDASLQLIKELNNIYPELRLLLNLNLREWMRMNDPRSIDWTIVKKRMDYAFKATEILNEILTKPLEEITSSTILKLAFERLVHTIVESILDTARHIVSVKGWGPAETYRDYIEILHKQGIISPELAQELYKFITWRNILVHRYIEINYSKLYEDSKKLTTIVREFEKQIIKLKEKHEETKHNKPQQQPHNPQEISQSKKY
ncbi:MAG: hypothetical protein DRJ40_02630 [Thermoprotei archaeon]|nr:MAG: hypothetical protein DRJ40_02630 [Thermoprotei archaeon]